MFTLQIKLGNEEMHSPHHVAAALREVAGRLDNTGVQLGSIFDINGNRVGRFELDQD